MMRDGDHSGNYHHPSSICNGLLLLLLPGSYDYGTGETTKPPGEALWNPTTGEFKILPLPPSYFDPRCVKKCSGYFGFGFDSASEVYKVIRLLTLNAERYPHTPAVMAELYSLRTNSWKQVSVVHPSNIPQHSGVHVNDTYYWLNRSDPCFIVSFDFATEKFASSVIPAPPSDKLNERNTYDNVKLVEYCGLLGAMVISGEDTWPRSLEKMRSLKIWVWDGSWSLVSTLSVPSSVGDLYILVGTDNLIFLDNKGKPMLFDFATSKLEKIRDLPTYNEALCVAAHVFPFVESYFSLDG